MFVCFVCLSSLQKLFNVSTIDVQDAFQKLREQILLSLTSNPSELRGGLNIINNTNLDYFSKEQKAELFRLKACFLEELKHLDQVSILPLFLSLNLFTSLQCPMTNKKFPILNFISCNSISW